MYCHSPCFVTTTTNGTKYVAIFENPFSSAPTRNVIEHPDGKIEEWGFNQPSTVEFVQVAKPEYVQPCADPFIQQQPQQHPTIHRQIFT